jgi:hypothetical protein
MDLTHDCPPKEHSEGPQHENNTKTDFFHLAKSCLLTDDDATIYFFADRLCNFLHFLQEQPVCHKEMPKMTGSEIDRSEVIMVDFTSVFLAKSILLLNMLIDGLCSHASGSRSVSKYSAGSMSHSTLIARLEQDNEDLTTELVAPRIANEDFEVEPQLA